MARLLPKFRGRIPLRHSLRLHSHRAHRPVNHLPQRLQLGYSNGSAVADGLLRVSHPQYPAR